MKQLAYTGLKTDGERAFKEHTGIEWFQGDVKEVADDVAAEMLKHPTIWCEVPAPAVPLAAASAANPAKAGEESDEDTELPEWAKKGIELGATDEQLEAVAQAGGPETEQGAALWKDATGTDWTPAAVAAPPAQAKPAPAKNAPAAKKTGRAGKRAK